MLNYVVSTVNNNNDNAEERYRVKHVVWCVLGHGTVPFQSIRQVPWHVTHLTKIWFRQPPNFAVTCTKISAVWRRRRRKISILGIWSSNNFVTSPKWPWQSWHFVDFGRPMMRDRRIDWNGTVYLFLLLLTDGWIQDRNGYIHKYI